MKNALLLVASLLIALLLSEFAVRILAPQNLSGSWRVYNENGLLMNKSSGRSRHQFGKQVVYYTFSYPGLRGPVPDASKKTILLLGDSYTFGWLLKDKDTYAYKLQMKLDNRYGKGAFRILDAAAGGWGTSDYLAYLEDYGKQLHPDYILIVINTDDIGRSIKRSNYILLDDNSVKRKRTKGSSLKTLLDTLPFYQWLLEHSDLIQIARKSYLAFSLSRQHGTGHGPENFPTTHLTVPLTGAYSDSGNYPILFGDALFRRIQEVASGIGSRLLVTTTGFHKFAAAQADKLEPTRRFMAQADSFFPGIKVEYHDISPAVFADMNGSTNGYIIEGEGHPNSRATTVIADNIWKWLTRGGVLPAPPVKTGTGD